jgi:hypothetical protein
MPNVAARQGGTYRFGIPSSSLSFPRPVVRFIATACLEGNGRRITGDHNDDIDDDTSYGMSRCRRQHVAPSHDDDDDDDDDDEVCRSATR